MKLYGYWRSSCSWRVRIALNLKGISYEYVPVNLLKGEHRTEAYGKINPLGMVPTLEIDGRRLMQSLAIIEYLDETHPAVPLLPRDPYLRARARLLAETVNSSIQPLQNMRLLNQVKEQLHSDDKAFAREWIQRGLVAFDQLAAETAGKFCVGDTPSVADLCLVPQLFNARRFELDLAELPRLTRIEAACQAIPAFQRAHADVQPDKPRA